MIRQILYLSDPCPDAGTPGEVLDGILAVSRRNNPALGITGALTMTSGTYVQVLEGDPEVLDHVVAEIRDDHRHTGLDIVSDRMVELRAFSRFAMAFADPQEAARDGVADLVRQLHDGAGPGPATALIRAMAHRAVEDATASH
ncbi:BLUF domain-containing protein [Palleronia abyssalis]|uniref:BLUF domain-containing protein n=1 Tax=Palleronia abyssalis TaxID=1501240 RepID=A0A2R8BV13_9RHOB|nr:BLUF domain-containing protein [Palleronia abyssalis]SPJ23963.1 hypothetical protein PAA8504_01784 [Palleronia abyssalis]